RLDRPRTRPASGAFGWRAAADPVPRRVWYPRVVPAAQSGPFAPDPGHKKSRCFQRLRGAGATGLEPATSGVTGDPGRFCAIDRGGVFPVAMRVFGACAELAQVAAEGCFSTVWTRGGHAGGGSAVSAAVGSALADEDVGRGG